MTETSGADAAGVRTMKTLKKLFTQSKMTYPRVILLAVLCGVIPGLLMLPPFLEGTSLRQPGISYEFWVLAALFVALNCGRPLEAGIKTFLLFLVSQPLIYLVQVPFSSLGWGLFRYYPVWGVITLFTFPGGFAAWYVKKGNLPGVLIFSAANALLCLELPYFAAEMMKAFPKLLLTCLFLAAEIAGFPLLLFKDKKMRAVSYAIAAVLLGAGIAVQCRA